MQPLKYVHVPTKGNYYWWSQESFLGRNLCTVLVHLVLEERPVCLSIRQKVLKMQVIVPALLLGAAVPTLWGTFCCSVLSSNWTIITNLHTLFKSKPLTIWTLLLRMNLAGVCMCGGQRLTAGVFLNCSPLYLKRQSLSLHPAYPACTEGPCPCLQNTGLWASIHILQLLCSCWESEIWSHSKQWAISPAQIP